MFRDYNLKCIHCIGRIKEIIGLPVSKLEVKANPDTFMNCLHIVLKRYKTSSKSCLHLLHESNLGPNRRNWYSDPLHCIADMLSRGSNASHHLFPHFSNSEHYIEMINGRLHSILMALTDDELEQCNLRREAVGEITSHGVRAGAIIQIMEAKETITQTVTKVIMESIVHITAKDTDDNPPPKKKQRQMLIAPNSWKYKQRYRIEYEACKNSCNGE